MATLEPTQSDLLEAQVRTLQLPKVTKTSRKEPIGEGSYGSVFEVMVHQTICAAKEMYPIIFSPMKRKSFLSECVRCSRILHPNVVQFLGIYYPDSEAKLPWLVMEMMHTSLTKMIEKYQKVDFPFHFKMSIFVDVCQGLQFLHSQNLIHRDLSSNNILLTKHLVAKIGDLGQAKVILPGGGGMHTQTPGTPVFMSPEALSTANPVYGAPLDVFSFGCVCVHTVSLQWPIPLDKIGKNNVIFSEMQRREHLCAKMASFPKLKCLVENCLQDKPEDRPAINKVIDGLTLVDYIHLPHEKDSFIDLFNTTISREQDLTGYQKAVLEKDEEISHLQQQSNALLEQLEKTEKIILQNEDHIHSLEQEISLKSKRLIDCKEQISEKDYLISVKDKKLLEKDSILNQKEQLVSQKDNLLQKRNDELVAINIRLTEHRKEINNKDRAISEKDIQLLNLEQALAVREKQIFEKDQTLMQKDHELSQKDEEISLRNRQIQIKDREASQRSRELVQTVEELQQAQKDMAQKLQCCREELSKKDKTFSEELLQKDAKVSNLQVRLEAKEEQLLNMDKLLFQMEEKVLHNSQHCNEKLFQELKGKEFEVQRNSETIDHLQKEVESMNSLLSKPTKVRTYLLYVITHLRMWSVARAYKSDTLYRCM